MELVTVYYTKKNKNGSRVSSGAASNYNSSPSVGSPSNNSVTTENQTVNKKLSTIDSEGRKLINEQQTEPVDGEVKNSIKGEKTQFTKTRTTTKPTEAPIQKMFASVREVRNKTMKENGFADDEIEATNMFFDQLMDFMEEAKNPLFNEEKVDINEFSASAGNLDNVRFSITEESTEIERYEELKKKSITAVPYIPNRLVENEFELAELEGKLIKEAKKILRPLAKRLGLFRIYSNESIKIQFNFGSNNLFESLSKQNRNTYKDKFVDYAKMLSCFEDVVANAELIEVHRDDEGHNEVSNFLRAYVLVSAYRDGD